MCRALGLLALLGLLTAAGAGARDRPSLHDDWPSYLHDASNSGTSIDPSAPSPSTVGRLATAWSAVVELGQFNGMAISDGRIYVQGPHLNAYSATDGSGVWSVLANATGDGVPAVADGVVYVGASVDGKGALEAFDGATGALLRTTALPGSVDAQGSPTVADGEVFEPAAGLYAVDQTTGTVLWHVPDVSSIGAAAVVDGVVYVIGGSGGADLEALDARTGQLLWEGYPGHGAGLGEGTVTVSDGTAYYAFSDTAHAWVAAFSAGGCGTTPCKPLWTAQLPGVHAAAAPVVADGELFIGSDDTFYALDAHTGSLIWSSVLHGFIESSALVANGVVYVGTNETDLYAFGADACGGGPACAPLWHHHFPPPLGQASTQDGFTRPPIFAEGRLYALMGNGNLYALQVGAGGDEPETGWLYGPASDEGPTDDPFSIWFDSDDPTATFECEVDGGAWTPCTSPAWFAAGAPGQHMIEIRAVDAQGHADPTPLKFGGSDALTLRTRRSPRAHRARSPTEGRGSRSPRPQSHRRSPARSTAARSFRARRRRPTAASRPAATRSRCRRPTRWASRIRPRRARRGRSRSSSRARRRRRRLARHPAERAVFRRGRLLRQRHRAASSRAGIVSRARRSRRPPGVRSRGARSSAG